MKLEILHNPPAPGKAARTPILFVHGAYCAAWIWAEYFMPYFQAAGFPCHALSLRGHGDSEGDVRWASLSDYVDDVEAAARTLERPAILIGHSMGGLVVQHYLSRGNAARAGVLMASVPPSGLAASVTHMSFFAPDILWQLSLLQSLGPAAVSPEAMSRAFFSVGARIGQIANLLTRFQPESQRIAAELMSPAQPRPPEGKNKPPIFVIGGDADLFIPTVSLRETATYFSGELDLLKGAPHELMLDAQWWQPSADSIIAWLDARKL